MRKPIFIALFTLLLASNGWAQNNGQFILSILPQFLNNIQQRAQFTEQLYAYAQQMGNQHEMQICEAERQLHQMMYQGASELMQNPGRCSDPQVQKQFIEALAEYNYRTEKRDMRPYDQIQQELAQYKAYVAWRQGTPEGRASQQAETQNRNAAHQARMNSLNAQADARNAAWNHNQAVQDNRHQQYVHGIYNEYQYVNPNTNQGYWVPMENTNPAVRNHDGSYTPLVPYHNY